LDLTAPRRLTVIDPVKLTITNLEKEVKNPEKGSYDLTVSKNIWVERDDVRETDSAEFFGFAPGKIVGLKYFGSVKVT
jgi:glutaminyl-tRNA synthetase